MQSSRNPERGRPRSGVVTTYQFIFFTFHQVLERVSFDKHTAYRAALLLCWLQVWVVGAVCMAIGRITHTRELPPRPIWLALILVAALIPYFFVYQNGTWREYAVYFKQWPRRRLIVARVLLLAAIIATIILSFVLRGT